MVEEGAHSAKGVFARLVAPASSPAEAAAPIAQASHVLRLANQKVGALKFDAIGRPSLRLSIELSERPAPGALLKAVQGFVDSL